jgi:DNA-binding transcriptional LysR family regulator
MQLEALKIFSDVVRLRSFSRGAEANGVLQSAASQAVHSLERQLAVTLIDRSHRPFELTPEGKLFYVGCRQIIERFVTLETEVKRVQQDVNSVVRGAAIYSVGLGDMSRYIQRFSATHPQARVQVEYLHPDQVYERVLGEAVDFGIVSFPQRHKEIAVLPWREEAMVLACAPGHRLAGRKEVKLTELVGEKFVGFDRGLVVRKHVDRVLRRAGVKVDVAMEFDNIEAIKRAVEVGGGVAILPEPTLAREAALKTLVPVRLADVAFARPLGIIHRRGKKFYPNTQQFLELLQSNGTKEH